MQTDQLNNVHQLLTQHLGIWTSAETEKKSGRGRASGNAGSVYGIKKLRELILELAVRGKLVPQDANDEPASELLKRIQAEKTKLIAEGKLKKEKSLGLISEDEKPFELPKCWEWTYFSDIAQHNSGKTLDTGRNKGLLRDYITTSNLYWGLFELDSVKQMPIEESELVRCTASKGDLLICEGGEAGRAAVWAFDKEVCFQNHIHRARFFGHISPFYAYRYFEKLNASGEIELYRKGVGISNMSGKALASVVFALPPLAEQHRIVAKVDAFMALCDQLENQHLNAAEAHETLVSELLATLTQSQDAADFNANWLRIHAHFDVLFTTQASIAALKQTLLQLAVMGKLVPQDPNDEPASELLKRVQAEKAKLFAEGKLKKEKPLAPIREDEKSFEVPKGWEWERLGIITNFGVTEKLNYISNDTWVLDLEDIEKDTSIIIQKNRFHKKQSLSDKNSFKCGDVLYGKLRPYLNKVVIADEDGVCTTEILPIRCYGPFNNKYFMYALKAPYFIDYVNARSYGMKMPRLGTDDGRNSLLPLAPLAEQHRIVAKVDALMALCDQLNTRIQQASQQKQLISDALVAQTLMALTQE